MSRRLALGLAALVVCASALSGCSEAKDAVGQAAGGIASNAASKAASAAAQVVEKQLCTIASDGKVSASESKKLNDAINAAESTGVPRSVIDAARKLAQAPDSAKADAAKKVQQECAKN